MGKNARNIVFADVCQATVLVDFRDGEGLAGGGVLGGGVMALLPGIWPPLDRLIRREEYGEFPREKFMWAYKRTPMSLWPASIAI